jgi:hypothetical protein
MNSEASNVLKVYLGASETGGYRPFDHDKRMSVAYNHDADAKLSEIKKYLEVDHPQPEWSCSDLAQEQKAFEALLAHRFPELDKVAVNALACRWSYSWR